MRRNTLRVLIVVVAAVGLVAGACGGDDKSDSTTTTAKEADGSGRGNVDGQLLLGALVPQTGDLSAIAKSLQTPIEMAVASINEAGGVNGKPVKVNIADDGTNPNVAATSYAKLVNTDKVDAIIGPAPSGVAAKMLDSFKTDKVPACSGSTTAANLKDGGGGYFFRTAPGDDLQGPALATLITNDGHKKVAILARNDDYGKGFASSLQTDLQDGGATVTQNVSYDPNAPDLKAQVQQALGSNPEAVAVIAFTDDGAKILSGMIESGWSPGQKPVYGTDGIQGDTVDAAGQIKPGSVGAQVNPNDPTALDGLMGSAPAFSVSPEFKTRFEAVKPPTAQTVFTGQAYDCVTIIALAAEQAKSDKTSDIVANISKVTNDGEVCNSFSSCKELIAAGKDVAYVGAVGEINLDQNGDPTVGDYDIWELQQGRLKTLETVKQTRS